MSRRQASADDGAQPPVKCAIRVGQISATGQLGAHGEPDEGLIASRTMRKVELAWMRALGRHTSSGDPQASFDWGL